MKTIFKLITGGALILTLLVLIFSEFYTIGKISNITTSDANTLYVLQSAAIFSVLKMIGYLYLIVLITYICIQLHKRYKSTKEEQEVYERILETLEKLKSKAESGVDSPVTKEAYTNYHTKSPIYPIRTLSAFIKEYGSPGNIKEACIKFKEYTQLWLTSTVEDCEHLTYVILQEWFNLCMEDLNNGAAPFVESLPKDMARFKEEVEKIKDKLQSRDGETPIPLEDRIISIGRLFIAESNCFDK